jgi:hypothetical protein
VTSIKLYYKTDYFESPNSCFDFKFLKKNNLAKIFSHKDLIETHKYSKKNGVTTLVKISRHNSGLKMGNELDPKIQRAYI